MNRRNFMLALGALAATPEPRRVYSFLWDNSLVRVPNLNGDILPLYNVDPTSSPMSIMFDYAYFEKKIFTALRIPAEYLAPHLSSGRAQQVHVQAAVEAFRRSYPAVGQMVDDVKKRSTR